MKKRFILSILLVLILLASCGVAKPTEQTLDTVSITLSKKISYGPLFIAEAEGYFKEFGIQIVSTQFENSSQAIALLVSGDTDVYTGVLNAGLLNILSLEPNIKVVADRGHIAVGDECTYQAIIVRKDLFDSGVITSAADLKGQVISTGQSGPDGFVVSSYLSQADLNFEDVELVDLPKSALVDAFKNKTIAAVHLPEPDLTTVLNAGDSVMLTSDEAVVGTLQSGVVAFGKKLLVDNPDLGVRFLAAYLKGIKQYNEGKTDRNIEILAERLGISSDVLLEGCWPNMREDGSIDFRGVEPFQKWSIENGFLDNAITQEQFYNPDFLEAAWVLLNK
jgi:NitT/TauT family transport system substrate-binding protein